MEDTTDSLLSVLDAYKKVHEYEKERKIVISDSIKEDYEKLFSEEYKDLKSFTYNLNKILSKENVSKDVLDEVLNHFRDYIDWEDISNRVYLPEDIIEKYGNYIHWNYISGQQKLSEAFIHKNKDKVSWTYICMYQRLSESFMRDHLAYLDWDCVSYYQTLSEDFMRENKEMLDWDIAYMHQKMSYKFICEHSEYFSVVSVKSKKLTWLKNIILYKKSRTNSWLYKSTFYKKIKIKMCNLYECHDDYFIAYKGIRKDRYSNYNFQYRYLKGDIHESNADHTNISNSYGLNVWTKPDAYFYCRDLVVTCKVYYKDVAAIAYPNRKIRCTKLEVLN